MSGVELCGLLNVFKPAGWTSRDVVNRVERATRPAKAGHAGTLDPLAEGVLVVCVGKATRLISAVQEQRKTYHGTFELGARSNTDDNTGEITVTENPTPFSREQIQKLLPEFLGTIQQVPPQFSAVHVDGQRAYALARQGQVLDLPSREIEIYRIEIIRYEWPQLELVLECGSGTYVRSVGRDLGDRLGCGAMMTALQRTRIGQFDVADSITIDDLTRETIASHVLPPSQAVAHWPQYVCSESELWDVVHGRRFVPRESITGRVALMTAEGILAACGATTPQGAIAPAQVYLDRDQVQPPVS